MTFARDERMTWKRVLGDHVVIPSMPGYGFSLAAEERLGPRHVDYDSSYHQHVVAQVTKTAVRKPVSNLAAVEPGRICPDVYHGDRGDRLELSDELEKEGSRRLAARRHHMTKALVRTKIPVRRNAAEIEVPISGAYSKGLLQRGAKRRIPVALERQQTSQDGHGGLASMRDRHTGAVESPHGRRLVLGIADVGGRRGLLGLEYGIDALGGNDMLALKGRNKGRVLPVKTIRLGKATFISMNSSNNLSC